MNKLKKEKASVVTDHIKNITESGILLNSGKELKADVIVTATGLNLEMLSNVDFVVDNNTIDISKTVTYKGMMYSGVPNLASTFGYTNASWTLGADLTSEYVCRIINHMKKNQYDVVCPQSNDEIETDPDYLNFLQGILKDH